MSESLAVKYRPKKFSDLTEQDSTVIILEEQIKRKETKNAYLFVGSAGTGKTTSARIFANLINEGRGKPIELDAASNNSVEDVRKLIEQSQYQAMSGEHKIYILDEVHSFSAQAFQALLKILEEPPLKTKFILCTTDPQKIPNTILSRVQRFNFTRLSEDGIIKRLKYICEQENIKVKEEVIDYIAKQADGGMRDAISMLDKCLSYNKPLTVESVASILGSANYNKLWELLEALSKKELDYILNILDEQHKAGGDIKLFIKHFIYMIVDIVKYKEVKDISRVKIPRTLESKLIKCKYEEDIMINILSKLVKLDADIKWNPNPLSIVEAFFIVLIIRGVDNV